MDFFALHDYQIEVATGGELALAKMRSFYPDFIFLDLDMPGMDGLSVARAVRNDPVHEDVVLIALTGWSDIDMLYKIRAADFSAFITKPVNMFDLLKYMEQGVFLREHMNRKGAPIKCLNPIGEKLY